MSQDQRISSVKREWRERIDRWQASGLSIRQFCAKNRLTESTFYLWKRELQSRDQASLESPVVPPKFVPVTVVPSATVSVEVNCPSGHVVCLSACEISALAALFAALDPRAQESRIC